MQIIDDLVVEFPQGAGGIFLSCVLACCIKNLPWQERKVNFHSPQFKTKTNHWFEPANNIISIDDPRAKYNFWMYYFKKRVVHELSYYRFQQQRWIKCPYQDLDAQGDALWLLNQCKFIISYQSLQPWKINWCQMLEQPSTVWPTIQNFLEANNQPNYWNLEKWLQAVSNYRDTLPKKVSINTHHVRWQIWSTALLQLENIHPEFDLVENFNNEKFVAWRKGFDQQLIQRTKQCLWAPVDQ